MDNGLGDVEELGAKLCSSSIPKRWCAGSGSFFASTGEFCPVNREELGGRRSSARFAGLIQTLAKANPLWHAPRIHGELKKLGIAVSERTVSRVQRSIPRESPVPFPIRIWQTAMCIASGRKNALWRPGLLEMSQTQI